MRLISTGLGSRWLPRATLVSVAPGLRTCAGAFGTSLARRSRYLFLFFRLFLSCSLDTCIELMHSCYYMHVMDLCMHPCGGCKNINLGYFQLVFFGNSMDLFCPFFVY